MLQRIMIDDKLVTSAESVLKMPVTCFVGALWRNLVVEVDALAMISEELSLSWAST